MFCCGEVAARPAGGPPKARGQSRADLSPSAASVTGRRPPSTKGKTRAYPGGPGLAQPSSPSEARCKIPRSTNTVPDTSSCSKRVPLSLPLQPGPQPPPHLLSPSQKSRSGGADVQQQTKWLFSFPWSPGMSFRLVIFSSDLECRGQRDRVCPSWATYSPLLGEKGQLGWGSRTEWKCGLSRAQGPNAAVTMESPPQARMEEWGAQAPGAQEAARVTV